MNLNAKLESEEEQTLQYVNRFAINLPTGAATFNLNIVNPGLSNQGYILNPVNSVGQNIVAYQPSMAVQSYFTLPSEGDGNIIHSLPVGVPVPVGVPMPTSLIQNSNFLNAGILIGNEECNSSELLKPPTSINPENEYKISYIEKPMEEISNIPNTVEVQNINFSCLPQLNVDKTIKKPCPLEMSIKAANIDMEFEKCETDLPISLENFNSHVDKSQFMLGSIPVIQSGINSLEVPMKVSTNHTLNSVLSNNVGETPISKTKIMWESNNVNDRIANNVFQESLICEVEEVNDDDDGDGDDDDDDDDDYDDEEDEEVDRDVNGERKENPRQIENIKAKKPIKKKKVDVCSSDDSDNPPFTSLKGKKQPINKKNNVNSRVEQKKHVRRTNEEKLVKTKLKKSKKKSDDVDFDVQWSESDDDVLNMKRNKNESNYKCYYEPGTTKSATSIVIKIGDKPKKFVRVRSCCSKKECGKKISVKDQKAAFKIFYDLESNLKRDAYLINCIEHVQKNTLLEQDKIKMKTTINNSSFSEPEDPNPLVNENIQLEIQNESKGNQKLCDEIQNAIQESLKDCITHESTTQDTQTEDSMEGDVDGEKREKSSWNFYIVVDRCRKKVCLQFLLKLFHITKHRIKQLQNQILSGAPLTEESTAISTTSNQKSSDIWEMAKNYLDNLEGEKCEECEATPRHRFLSGGYTKEDLFVNFKEYYRNQTGKEPNIKSNSYKRFLDKKTNISFSPRTAGICAECTQSKKNQKRKSNKTVEAKGKDGATEPEVTSDDEPLSKKQNLKITIPLKSGRNKKQRNQTVKERIKKEKGTTTRSKGRPVNKGRDVWSLMLLHLETMPYKICYNCVGKNKHRFLDSTFTTQSLFEDYRKYFLKETNSELGLGFTMYDKYFNRNCNYTIADVDVNAKVCPRCASENNKS